MKSSVRKLCLFFLVTVVASSSCKTTDSSAMKSVGFESEGKIYAVNFKNSLITVYSCTANDAIRKVQQDAIGVEELIEVCPTVAATLSVKAAVDAFKASLLVIPKEELATNKDKLFADLRRRLDEAEKRAAELDEEFSIVYQDLPEGDPSKAEAKKQLDLAKNALAALKADHKLVRDALDDEKISQDGSELQKLDIMQTLSLLGVNDASNAATHFTRLLTLSPYYRLDPLKHTNLVKTILSFQVSCEEGLKGGEEKFVDQGFERVRYLCQPDGKIVPKGIECPHPGYEPQNDMCIFTGGNLKFSSLAAGNGGVCAITSDRLISCFGHRGIFPTDGTVPGAAGTMTSLVFAGNRGCGFDQQQNLVDCWPKSDKTPKGVQFRSISSGYDDLCGIENDGSLRCWGRDTTPAHPGGDSKIKSINQVLFGSCAVLLNGDLKCWTGAWTEVPPIVSPGAVHVLSNPNATMSQGCAINQAGKLKCWPTQAVEGNARFIHAATLGACATMQDGKTNCWPWTVPDPNNPPVIPYREPPKLNGLRKVVSDFQRRSLCGIFEGGKVACWGDDRGPQTSGYLNVPPNLEAADDLVMTDAGMACALTGSGKIRCWGETEGITVPPDFK